MVADEKYHSCTVRLSDHHSHTLSCPTWGRGSHRKGRGGRFSGLNAKPDTNSQPYLTILYTSQGFRNTVYFGLDAMKNPRKSISGVQLVEAVLKKIKFVKGQIG
jgi:hypothetical protein